MPTTGFLELGSTQDIQGNVQTENYLGTFAVQDFTFDLFRLLQGDQGDVIALNPLVVDLSAADGAIGDFAKAASDSMVFDKVTLTVAQTGGPGDLDEIQKLELDGAKILSFHDDSDETARIALSFAAITVTTSLPSLDPDAPFSTTYQAKIDDAKTVLTTDGLSLFDDNELPDRSASRIFAKFEGIDGESQSPDHVDKFDAVDFTFGLFRDPSDANNTLSLDPIFLDIVANDPGTTTILDRLLTATAIPTMTVQRTPNTDTGKILEDYKLADVAVDSFVRDDDFETRIGLSARKLSLTSSEFDETGGSERTSSFEFDVNASKFPIEIPRADNTEPFTLAPSSPAAAYLKLPEIDGESKQADFIDWFDLAGYGYAVNSGISGPEFTGLTVDLESEASPGIADLLTKIYDDSEFTGDINLTRRAGGTSQNDIEVIDLAGGALASLSFESGLAPRGVLGFEAFRTVTTGIDEVGGKGTGQTSSFNLITGKTDFVSSALNNGLLPSFADPVAIGPREATNTPLLQVLDFGDASGIEGSSQVSGFTGTGAFDVLGFSWDLIRIADPLSSLETNVELSPIVVDLDPGDGGILGIIEAAATKQFLSEDAVLSILTPGTNAVIGEYTLGTPYVLGVDQQSGGATRVALGYSFIDVSLTAPDPSGGVPTPEVFMAKVGQIDAKFGTFTPVTDVSFAPSGDGGAPRSVDRTNDMFLNVNGIDGDAVANGHETDFVVSGFEFDLEQLWSTNVADTTSDGKLDGWQNTLDGVEFDPLIVDIVPGAVGDLDLMGALADGTKIADVTLKAYTGDATNSDTYQQIVLNDATLQSIDLGAGEHTRLAFGFKSVDFKTVSTNDLSQPETRELSLQVDPNVPVSSSGARAGLELDRPTLSFLEFPDSKLQGNTLDANHPGQFDVLDWDLNLKAVAGTAGTQSGYALAPLRLTLDPLSPAVTQLLQTSIDFAFPSVRLNVAVQQPTGTEDFDRIELRNVRLLEYDQQTDRVELTLGYGQLARSIRSLEVNGTFSDFVEALDFQTDDFVLGDAAGNTLRGGGGNDSLFANDGDDLVEGGDGDDEANAGSGAGNDTYDGGAGNDVITFRSTSQGVFVDLEAGGANGAEIDTDILIDIEHVVGGSGNDTILGNGAANSLDGAAGDDTITGRGTGDHLIGGAGNDTLEGGPGADSLNGGDDIDTVSYAGSAVGVLARLDGIVGAGGDAQGDIVTNTENLIGSAQSDQLAGDAGNNSVNGGGGNDILLGAAGTDTIVGGGGFDFADYRDATGALVIDLATPGNSSAFFADDTLVDIKGLFGATTFANMFNGDEERTFFTGGDEDDVLSGNGGGDILRGRAGNDTIDGGDGRDALLGNTGNDTLTGGMDRDIFWFGIAPDGNDVITDFTIGQDLIGFQGTAVNQITDLTFATSAGGWALLEWNGGADSVELENITATQANAAGNFFFI